MSITFLQFCDILHFEFIVFLYHLDVLAILSFLFTCFLVHIAHYIVT